LWDSERKLNDRVLRESWRDRITVRGLGIIGPSSIVGMLGTVGGSMHFQRPWLQSAIK